MEKKVSNKKKSAQVQDITRQAWPLETIGLLTAGIVHDFNNLISTISGYAEMINDELPEGSSLSEKISKIRSAAARASLISQQILKIGSTGPDEKTHVNVNEILRETLNMVKSLPDYNIKIKSRIPEKEFFILVEPTQLFRVFLNIITNAIQSMEGKGGLLSVRTSVSPAGKIKPGIIRKLIAPEYVIVSIKDNGPGIDGSIEKRICEPFFTGRINSPGKGLGLSIVYNIVEEMNGAIRVSSKMNSGTVFKIYLPFFRNYQIQVRE